VGKSDGVNFENPVLVEGCSGTNDKKMVILLLYPELVEEIYHNNSCF